MHAKPTQILAQEHQVILQVLECLEKMADEAAAGRLDGGSAREAVEFFRGFADRCHHGKEEVHLFPAMEAKGYSPECGPTAVMRQEHELGRTHIRGMDESIAAAAEGDRQALERFVRNARAYLVLLRQHIDKEDHCLFPMADQALSENDQHFLLGLFARVEDEEMGAGTHERFVAIAERLADRYGVAKTTPAGAGCCGHQQ